MGNPSSEAARRRSPRRRKQFNGNMVKGLFCFVLVVAFAALATTAPPYRPGPGETLFRGKLISGLASMIVTPREIGFLNQLAKGMGKLEAFINELEKWNDVDCNGKPTKGWTRTALCEKKSCAAPWTQLSTGCYRFHETPMTQSEAKKFCEEEQEVPARLVEIDSAEENRAIVAEMQRQNSFSRKINFWLGINDRHSEGHWVLESTGKSVVFTA